VPNPIADGSTRLATAFRERQQRLADAVGVLESASVEDVHGARVAARRLRSMLKTFRPLVEPRRARRYRADLRSFARSLGSAREADVRRELLLALAATDEGLTAADHRRLRELLDDACIASREQLGRHIADPGWSRLCRALERHRTGNALFAVPNAELGAIVQLVADAWRRPVRLLRAEPTETAELHELRLAFKHCRYALEPVADIAPKATARLLRRLRAAQDRIGEHRDTLLAEHWVLENERALGRVLVARLVADLRQREKALRRQSAIRAAKVLDAWRDWRDATRRIRKAKSPGRG
jgi:CHAD domain-containing protein